ncbi:MAG: rRNA pseudouridine synthase, partial [Nitrosopumilus sp.]|nr:rRNA pseudouridine synthase [Nitrosopumilus sp.]
EGLILLTNDGGLARRFELPLTRIRRTYRIRVFGNIPENQLIQLKRGITVDGIRYGPIDARILEQQRSNCWLSVVLTEGKNRELRNVFTYLGYPINRLLREGYGPFYLDDLQPGDLREVPHEAIQIFLQSLDKNS